ncbi:hypothetical protein EDD85DRAFT_274418 [Armillaria nabsnona]|nr:hypothetical protein EDD85DRAFT_274418 [Armillaria nabsnona]
MRHSWRWNFVCQGPVPSSPTQQCTLMVRTGIHVHSQSLRPLYTRKTGSGTLELTPTKSSEDTPLATLKRLLSHRHSHSLSVADERPNEHSRHRNCKLPIRQSAAHHSLLSTSPNLACPPTLRPAGVVAWVRMQGLTYLEDAKEEYASFYGHEGRRLLKVVRDMLHASDIFLAEARVETIHSSSNVMVVDGEKDEQDQGNGDAELSPCVVPRAEQSPIGNSSARLGYYRPLNFAPLMY